MMETPEKIKLSPSDKIKFTVAIIKDSISLLENYSPKSPKTDFGAGRDVGSLETYKRILRLLTED